MTTCALHQTHLVLCSNDFVNFYSSALQCCFKQVFEFSYGHAHILKGAVYPEKLELLPHCLSGCSLFTYSRIKLVTHIFQVWSIEIQLHNFYWHGFYWNGCLLVRSYCSTENNSPAAYKHFYQPYSSERMSPKGRGKEKKENGRSREGYHIQHSCDLWYCLIR